MELGMIGLGRMGGNMAMRLLSTCEITKRHSLLEQTRT